MLSFLAPLVDSRNILAISCQYFCYRGGRRSSVWVEKPTPVSSASRQKTEVFEAYGYRIGFRYPAELQCCIDDIILPTWKRGPSTSADAWLTARPVAEGYEILDDGKPWTTVKAEPGAEPTHVSCGDWEREAPLEIPHFLASAKAQHLLRHRLQQLTQIRLTAGVENYAFVHAGVVLCQSGLVVIPGPAKIGKSTLVKELCSRGARFYSDEFAVINPQGLVESYPRDLWTRVSKKERLPQSAASLGWTLDLQPAPISLLLFATYKAGAVWEPKQLSKDEALELMLEQTKLPDSGQLPRTLIEKAVQASHCLQGPRGSFELIDELTRNGELQV